MKGIILAGGSGSRLLPLTKVTNKHLLPIGRKPMIYYPIEKLREAGIEEILVVTGRDHMGDVMNLLGSGREFELSFTYRVQDEAGGIAQALGLGERFVAGDLCTVILGDNIFRASIRPHADAFRKQARGAKILLKRVKDPGRYGVAEVSLADRKILSIEEKPSRPKSDLAVTGIYMYDAEVFEIIRTLRPSGRGELEITDVNNAYVQRGTMTWDELEGEWTDAGTFESWLYSNELMAAEDGS
jgi:glucose-1-phosphate thymidylyltransferase